MASASRVRLIIIIAYAAHSAAAARGTVSVELCSHDTDSGGAQRPNAPCSVQWSYGAASAAPISPFFSDRDDGHASRDARRRQGHLQTFLGGGGDDSTSSSTALPLDTWSPWRRPAPLLLVGVSSLSSAPMTPTLRRRSAPQRFLLSQESGAMARRLPHPFSLLFAFAAHSAAAVH